MAYPIHYTLREHALNHNIPFAFMEAVKEALEEALCTDLSKVIDLRKWGAGMSIDGRQQWTVRELINLWNLEDIVLEERQALEVDAQKAQLWMEANAMGLN